jgi:hypothetical protein
MFRSLFFSESEHSYQPVPTAEPALESIPYAPFTTLPQDVVLKIAGHLADMGDWKAIAALCLTNKRLYGLLRDNSKYGNFTMPVTIDQQRHYLPIKNINHVVLANYFVSIDQHKQDVHNEVDGAITTKEKADCICCIASCATGIVGCIACHVGTSLLCDWVVLPGIAKILPGNCFSAWCPGEVFTCTYNNAPKCYSACCCPCCCGGDPWLTMRFADLGFLVSNLCAYNATAIIPDICGGWLLWSAEMMLGNYYERKVTKKRDVFAEVTELAPLSDPHKKISAKIIGTLFHMNEAICHHKNRRHKPPAVIRMEDVHNESLMPPRVRMN